MEVNVNDENFEEEVLNSDMPVLVDFWAPWCGPCHMVAPIVEEIGKEYEGKLKVCKINIDEAPQTAARYGIMSIPTLGIFKDGQMADSVLGAVPKDVLIEKIGPHVE